MIQSDSPLLAPRSQQLLLLVNRARINMLVYVCARAGSFSCLLFHSFQYIFFYRISYRNPCHPRRAVLLPTDLLLPWNTTADVPTISNLARGKTLCTSCRRRRKIGCWDVEPRSLLGKLVASTLSMVGPLAAALFWRDARARSVPYKARS